jgi:putative Ig domain-containing protein
MKRLALVVGLVAAVAVVAVPSASALAFADQPCVETHPSSGILLVCPQGVVGSSYSTQLASKDNSGNGPPYTFHLKSGSLPAGLQLNTNSGLISGVPTSSGTVTFGLELQDFQGGCAGCGCLNRTPPTCAYRDFAITVHAGIAINNQVTTKYGTLNQPYSDQLTATMLTSSPPPAGAPTATATWSKVSGDLPPGVTLSSTGLVSGTPTAEAVYVFKVRAQLDASRWDEETITIDVKKAVEIAAPKVPSSEVGVPFTLALAATGGFTGTGTYTWTITGTLPTGVVFSPLNSTLGGTPRAAGAFGFTATATDQHGRVATYQGRIVVAQKLAISTLRLKQAKVGRLYRAKLATTGGVQPKKWKLKGKLPRGVRFDKSLGVLSGTPLKAGRYRITAEATDALKVKSTKTFTIIVLA